MKNVIATVLMVLFVILNVSAEKNSYKYRDHLRPEKIPPRSMEEVTPPPVADEVFSPAEFSSAHGIYLGWEEGLKVVLKDIAYEVSKLDTVYVVHMLGQDSVCENYFTDNDVNMDNVKFINADTNDVSVWIRDYGPFYIYEDGNRAIVQYDYKFFENNPIPGIMADVWGFEYYHSNLRISGGNFMADGNGMGFVADVVCAENVPLTDADIRSKLMQDLGLDSISFVKSMKKDGTGHIDMAQKLLNDTLILVGEYLNPGDAYGQNQMILNDNAEFLSSLKTLDGRSFNVVRIPMPPIYYIGTNIVTSSYTNSLIINNKVLVPIYGDSLVNLDTTALNIYKELMPDYEVVGINSAEVIKSNGAVHCITKTHFKKNPLVVFHSYFDSVQADVDPVIDFSLNPRFKTMSGSVFYKAESAADFTEVAAVLENGIFSATLPKMGENFNYYFTGAATSGTEQFTVSLPEDAPTSTFSAVVIPTGIKENMLMKKAVAFSQYPNPFNDKTTLTYTVNKNCKVSLAIYNMYGRKVCSLVDGFHTAGSYKMVWNGTNKAGEQVSSGIYYSLLTINNGGQDLVRKKNKMFIVR